MTTQSTFVGAYSPLLLANEFTKEYVDAFEHVSNVVGVKYTALAGQSQVVAGTNFAFYCLQDMVVAPSIHAPTKLVEIVVNHDLQGKYQILSNEIISKPILTPPIGSFDSVASRADFSELEQQAAKEIEALVGVKYEILAAQQQVVAGLNFAFYARITPAVRGGQAYFGEVDAFLDLKQQLHIESVTPIQP